MFAVPGPTPAREVPLNRIDSSPTALFCAQVSPAASPALVLPVLVPVRLFVPPGQFKAFASSGLIAVKAAAIATAPTPHRRALVQAAKRFPPIFVIVPPPKVRRLDPQRRARTPSLRSRVSTALNHTLPRIRIGINGCSRFCREMLYSRHGQLPVIFFPA